MAKQIKDESGKFVKHVMEGHLFYPSLNRPNTKFKKEGIYEAYLCPVDKTEITQAKEMNIKMKSWEDNGIADSIYFKQYTQRKDGTQNPPPPVITEEGQPFKFHDNGRDVIVGNGTRAKIQYYIYTIENSYGKFTNYMISKVKILELKEYTPEGDEDPTEANEDGLDF